MPSETTLLKRLTAVESMLAVIVDEVFPPKPRGRPPLVPDATLICRTNRKHVFKGNKGHIFSRLIDGMTIAEFCAVGGNRRDLYDAADKGVVELYPPPKAQVTRYGYNG